MNSLALQGEPECKLISRQNSSLSNIGKQLILLSIFFNLAVVGLFFAVMGAWPVLPYAGLEFLLLWYAFRRISERENDFECLTVADFVVAFESKLKGKVSRFECNRAWVQLLCRVGARGARCSLSLRYAGQTVSIGRLLTDDQRMQWAQTLQGKITTVRAAG